MGYRKILVAVDGSDSSKNAFRQACKIVREDKSWITVITTVPPYEDQFQTLTVKEKVTKALRREGQRILSEIKALADEEDVFIKEAIEEGSPSDAIVDFADEGGFDLIVMGRHGMTRLERALMGSVTARVIGHSRKDILVVPGGTKLGWKKILLSTDGSKSSEAAGRRALSFAKSHGGTLTAISIVDVNEEFYTQAPDAVEAFVENAGKILKKVRENAEASAVGVETFVREGEAYLMIVELARAKKADVIFMGSHGRRGVRKLLIGSVAEKVIGHSPCPVLVVKA